MALAKMLRGFDGIYTILTPAAHIITTIFYFCMEMFYEDGSGGPCGDLFFT